MQITIDHKNIDIIQGETLLESAKRSGIDIPSMCYAENAQHKSSCMVCAVKNKANGQIIPSCSTLATKGMQIESETDEVKQIRSLSLELLLSDHKADCEAPCSAVCPKGLDVEYMLYYYDKEKYQEACQVIKGAFDLPILGCDDCKAPCEKACRRKSIDKTVAIREIIREVVGMFDHEEISAIKNKGTDKKQYQSRLGIFTDDEKQRLKETVTTASRCLHCACARRNNCKLRTYATSAAIKRPRYGSSSELPVMNRMHVKDQMWFEQAKCIRCGLCVYNSNNGFTFKDRGFGMQVHLPEENKVNVSEELAELCPTGALYTVK